MQSEELTGKLAGTTRRSFIRGIAAPAGAAAYALDRAASDRCSAAPRTRTGSRVLPTSTRSGPRPPTASRSPRASAPTS